MLQKYAIMFRVNIPCHLILIQNFDSMQFDNVPHRPMKSSLLLWSLSHTVTSISWLWSGNRNRSNCSSQRGFRVSKIGFDLKRSLPSLEAKKKENQYQMKKAAKTALQSIASGMKLPLNFKRMNEHPGWRKKEQLGKWFCSFPLSLF